MKHVLIILILAATGVALFAQPSLSFAPVSLSGPGLSAPVDIVAPGDQSGRLFIVEKRGTIRIIQNGAVLSGFFLDIQNQVMDSGERGLLGMAFHPAFPDSPYVYVNYVIEGTIITRISRFTVNPDNANDLLEGSELELLTQAGVQSNHKAGDLAFGPDGYLYIGMGDGGGGNDPANASQNIESLLGKMLRIDVNTKTPPLNYSIPPDNPFVNLPGKDEIWATGLRNPWRISFDRQTGDLWIADVGQNAWEEVDMVFAGTPGGMNFGWDCYEGDNHPLETQNCPGNPTLTWPVFEYPHNCNPCPNGQGASITGGFVYRGDLYPVLEGVYVCADYLSNYLWMIKMNNDDPPGFDVYVQNGTGMVSGLVSFGEDDNGELYACNLQGVLYAVSASGTLPIQWQELIATRIAKGNRIAWTIHNSFGVDYFEVQRSLKSDFSSYFVAGTVSPVPDQIHYTFEDPASSDDALYYRIAAVMQDGAVEYSPIDKIFNEVEVKPSLVLNPLTHVWQLQLPEGWRNGEVIVYDLQGKEMYSRPVQEHEHVELDAPVIPGCYFVKVRGTAGSWSEQVVW